MKRTNILWIALLGGALIFGCSDSGNDPGNGGTAGTGADGGSGGSAGTGGTGGTAGVGGTDGDFGVVNVDIMQSVNPADGDDVYVGDDGVLSSTGGTYWNLVDSFTSVTDADDEFGASTPIDCVVNASGNIFIGAALNELQDNGISNLVEDPTHGLDFRDLAPDGLYDLAVYVYAETALGNWTTIDVTSASGVTSIGPNDEPTWGLPGEAGKDYFLFEALSPYEIMPGASVYGLRVNNLSPEGAILGAQLKRVD